MDKVKWLQKIAEQHPDDPEARYWLGKELAENCQYIEAIQSLSSAISHCRNEELKLEIIHELTRVSVHMQQGKSTVESESIEVHPTIAFSAESNENQLEEAVSSKSIENHPVESASSKNIEVHPTEAVPTDRPANPKTEPQTKMKKIQSHLKVIDGHQTKHSMGQKQNAVTFADVAGLEELKKTIHLRIISPFFNKGLFAKFRKKVGGGVLLYGPPGCGKTFIARATAGECHAQFYPVRITDILDPYIGVSERNLKEMFDKARLQKPSILFFDEVDTIGFSRSKSHSAARGVIDTFLSEMEGIDTSTDEVLVMAATNTPWDVDQALKRPGRFDRLIFVAPPDQQAREQIFKLKLQGRLAEEIDTAKLAALTEFFSGADIENIVELASEHLIEEILATGVERPLNTDDLLQALEDQQPSTLEWLRTAKNYVKYANQTGLYNDVEKYLRKHSRKL